MGSSKPSIEDESTEVVIAITRDNIPIVQIGHSVQMTFEASLRN